MSTPDGTRLKPDRGSALEENVQAIKRWEKTILLARSKAEQVSGGIGRTGHRDRGQYEPGRRRVFECGIMTSKSQEVVMRCEPASHLHFSRARR